MIRAGTYAKANAASRSWLQTPVSNIAVKGAKGRKSLTTVNPVFLKCSELTTDPFWIDIFLAASRGKFPKGFSYKDNSLFHRKRNKTSSVEVSENAIEAFEVCKTFFRSMGGIASQQEHCNNDSEDTNTSESLDDTSTESEVPKKIIIWSKIVPKKNKSLYLHSFINSFAKENKMNASETDRLQKMLNLAESLNLLNDSNVVFEGNSISHIIGLSFDLDTREPVFEPLKKPINLSKKSDGRSSKKGNGKQGFFLKLWDKYLTSYTKTKNASTFPVTGAPKTTLIIRTVPKEP